MSRPYQIFRSPLWKSNFQTPWSPNVIEYSRFLIVHSLIFANIREICKLTWQVLTSRDDSFPWQRFFPRLNFCDRFSFAVKSIRDPSFTYGEDGIFTFIWLLKASKRWSKTLESLFERGGISRDSGRCWRWWTFGGSFNHSMPLVPLLLHVVLVVPTEFEGCAARTEIFSRELVPATSGVDKSTHCVTWPFLLQNLVFGFCD